MKKRILFAGYWLILFIPAIPAPVPAFAQDGKELIKRSAAAIDNIKTLSYRLSSVLTHPFNKLDTSFSSAECRFRKAETDSLLGMYYNVKTGNYQLVYGNQKFIQIVFKDSSAKLYNGNIYPGATAKQAGGKDLYAGSSFWGIKKKIYEPMLVSEAYTLYILPDASIDGTVCYHLHAVKDTLITNAPEGKLSNRTRFDVFIDKSNYLPVCTRRYSATFYYRDNTETYQYEAHIYSDVLVNQRQDDSIYSPDNYSAHLLITTYTPAEKKTDPLNKLLGKPAPEWTLASVGGKTVRLKDFSGKPLLMYFWFVGCKFCAVSTPVINDIADQYKDRGLEVIGINAVDDNLRTIIEFAAKKKMNYLLLYKAGEMAAGYQITGFPTIILIRADGSVAYAVEGFDDEKKRTLESGLQKLIQN